MYLIRNFIEIWRRAFYLDKINLEIEDMNSPGTSSSPTTYKNLKVKPKQSPVELKEKMRKNYKERVQKYRNVLINKYRGAAEEAEFRKSLTDIYKSMFKYADVDLTDEEEVELMEIIKNELVQEELQWWLEEYEKSHPDNDDWCDVDEDASVICPMCQKANFTLENRVLSCPNCKLTTTTDKNLTEIRCFIARSIAKHNDKCTGDVNFTTMPEHTHTYIYLMCFRCMMMETIV
ncbi:RPA-interacting protein-like [Pectinophora gossypiella]|nr:RPA-interacting protein-like [Pectinophora gossypiella]